MVDKNKFLIELSASPKTDFGKVEFAKQSEPQQVFTCIWELEADVNNGGYSQYYFNCSGDTAHKAVWALEKVGARSMARIVRTANSVYDGGVPPHTQEKRQVQMEKLPPWVAVMWDLLDQEFYKYPDNLTDMLYAFVHEHREAFRLES